MLDDGTRYILSGMFVSGPYMISLCEFIPAEGNVWYSIAVESKDFIPTNGLMVFAFQEQDQHPPIILGQQVGENTTATHRSVGLRPLIFFGGGHALLGLATHNTTNQTEFYFGMYDLSEEELQTIINNKLKTIRITTRSRFHEFNKTASKFFSSELSDAKKHVNARAALSRNTILEGIE